MRVSNNQLRNSLCTAVTRPQLPILLEFPSLSIYHISLITDITFITFITEISPFFTDITNTGIILVADITHITDIFSPLRISHITDTKLMNQITHITEITCINVIAVITKITHTSENALIIITDITHFTDIILVSLILSPRYLVLIFPHITKR